MDASEPLLLDQIESGSHFDNVSKSGKYVHKPIQRNYFHALLRILGINAMVCGVEIVSSAGFTFIPPLLLKAGFSETTMTIILGIGKYFFHNIYVASPL